MIKFNTDDLFLVTGASSGIGRAIALKVIELGGSVIGIARRAEKLEETKRFCSNPDAFKYEIKDLSENMDVIPEWFSTLSERYGRFNGLALAAGVQESLPLAALKIEKMKNLFDVNFFSNIALIKGFSKRNNNIGAGSSIVIISSFTSNLGVPATVSYSSSKGAINSAVKTLAVELAKTGIRINAVLPGHVLTELLSSDKKLFSESFIESLKLKYPLGLGTPEDVANITCFLLSEAARWITGSNFTIDGGASVNF